MDTNAAVYARLGKRIRKIREDRGLTQKARASLVSLTRTSITNIERGKQKLLVHTLFQLAQALDVQPAVLLASEDFYLDEVPELDELLKNRPQVERDWIKATIDEGTKGA